MVGPVGPKKGEGISPEPKPAKPLPEETRSAAEAAAKALGVEPSKGGILPASREKIKWKPGSKETATTKAREKLAERGHQTSALAGLHRVQQELNKAAPDSRDTITDTIAYIQSLSKAEIKDLENRLGIQNLREWVLSALSRLASQSPERADQLLELYRSHPEVCPSNEELRNLAQKMGEMPKTLSAFGLLLLQIAKAGEEA